MIDWFNKWSDYTPDKVAVKEVDTTCQLTYKALNNAANGIAVHFTEKYMLNKGDRIVVLSDFHAHYFVLLGVAQKLGVIIVPVNYRLSAKEIDYIIKNAEPKVIIAEDKYASLIPSEDTPCLGWLDFVKHCEDASENDSTFEATQVSDEDPVLILYTSGTTGFPKGALYTHGMMLWNSINTSLRLKITSDDKTLMVMPPFHTGGWNVLSTPILHFGGTLILMPKFEANRALELLEKETISIFMAVPTMVKMMMESFLFEKVKLDALRYFIVGGEALPIPVIEQWSNKGILIRQGYGLTEVGPNVTSLEASDAIRKRGSIGFPNFYLQTRIVNEQGEEAAPNEPGELWLRGPVVTPGYWRNVEATEKALESGWFKTGDVVRRDEEGYFYVVDRIKNMFISGGENVYPAEVERVLLSHPAVAEAAVIGVADEKWGEVGKAFVVLKANEHCDEAALNAYCKEGLAKFKVPRYFSFIETLPKNETGKINRKSLVNLV